MSKPNLRLLPDPLPLALRRAQARRLRARRWRRLWAAFLGALRGPRCRYDDCRYDEAREDEQVTCPACRADLGLPEIPIPGWSTLWKAFVHEIKG